jgi:ABC-type uncharacterized transport system permease subunit
VARHFHIKIEHFKHSINILDSLIGFWPAKISFGNGALSQLIEQGIACFASLVIFDFEELVNDIITFIIPIVFLLLYCVC